jgi:2-polyprenyl-6-methoxyphenol hydroxylase-like FAD-dependent oxidoreductase
MAAGTPGSDALIAQVAIAGGGPVGLMLAIELGRRGVRTLLLNERPGTTPYPQANATQARTMEHYRRLGFAERIRATGLPPDYPTDICYFTRYAKHELARFSLPSSRDARSLVRSLGGSWSAAELPHRGSQMFIEPVLYEEAGKLPEVTLRYGWRVAAFEPRADAVGVTIERAGQGGSAGCVERLEVPWLVGCDGARSGVRRALGIGWTGETGVQRDFMGGRMMAMHFRSPDLYACIGRPPAWMYWTFNAGRRSFMAAIDGVDAFVYHTQLHPGEDPDDIDDAALCAMFFETLGARCEIEPLSRSSWVAGHALVAERMRVGRVFLAGDAAHLFTPAGGLGYNTGVDDAVNLGWKLAAVIRDGADPALLDSYEAERRPAAIRNTGYARAFADSIGLYRAPEGLEDDSAQGEALRREAGERLLRHARAEFNIPGITLGTRYDGSPIVVSDGSTPPADRADVYEPTSVPGGRAPHGWLPDGSSLFDRFGEGFTLLEIVPAGDEATTEGIPRSAAAWLGLPPSDGRANAALRTMSISHLPISWADAASIGLDALYPRRFTLIRPDQVVAWRGDRLPAFGEVMPARKLGVPQQTSRS